MADGKTIKYNKFLITSMIIIALTLLVGYCNTRYVKDSEIDERKKSYSKVNDYAFVLSETERSRIEDKLAKFEEIDSTRIIVLTVNTLNGESIENFSMRICETWDVGQKLYDKFLLFTIAVDDRKMRIEVGYALETILSDSLCGRILDNIVAPEFKKGDFNAGIEKGIDAMIKTIRGNYL